MILYVTKQTFERFKLKEPQDMRYPINVIAESVLANETGDRLQEWGGKLFYFDKRKCIQFVNFESKFTLFLFDVKVNDLPDVGNIMTEYMMDIYGNDSEMIRCLKKHFKEHSACCFSHLTDKSIITTLNQTQWRFADDGYRFYDFIENEILKTREINRKINFDWFFTKTENGKKNYFFSGERFRELLIKRYA